MPALDTNVLVRYLVRDDEAQGAAARRLLHAAVDGGQALYVPVTVMLELEWVLRAAYGFDKPAVLQALSALLSAAELQFGDEQALEVALHLYREGAADFADAVHVALASHAGHAPLLTFDRRAAKLAGAQAVAR